MFFNKKKKIISPGIYIKNPTGSIKVHKVTKDRLSFCVYEELDKDNGYKSKITTERIQYLVDNNL